ncbi:MAG TPA: hypothetical protein VEU30_03855 [Thermoanaerobaculia bacterium]|nr:hypothetical protein [Thermoanaerobaculia bacterium]
MPLSPFANTTLALEARALLTRVIRLQPFALVTPSVGAARVSDAAAFAIDRHVLAARRMLRRSLRRYLEWLRTPAGRGSTNAEAQRRFSFLKLRFNAVLTQLDIFADALGMRGEIGTGVWLSGLDVAAGDALSIAGNFFDPPPVMTYLDRGQGAAIRRARTRLPGGGANPVAIIRVPRERMVGSGVASSLVHEAGHQGAALLELLPSLRRELRVRVEAAESGERLAWTLWERWISEIVADFWAVAQVGVAATQGLMSVVSLPRAFVFRIAVDDPHPFPWIRVKLSAAAGALLYPDPQWSLLDQLWESYYPRTGLDRARLAIIDALEATMPAFLLVLRQHRPASLRGLPLVRAFDLASRRPERLRRIYRDSRARVAALQSLAPTVALAVLGQARQDQLLEPERESRILAELLTRWGLRRALRETRTPRTTVRALAA